MGMHYVISDLHGYPHERFLKLLEKAGFGANDFLYILGDVIDRNGDGGVQTLLWLLDQYNVDLIMGNHEAMLLANSFVFDELTESSLEALTAERFDSLTRYQLDGGDVTLKAMHKLPKTTQQDILDYLRDCPLYHTLEVGGREMILVHAGLGNFSKSRKIEDYTVEDLLWTWPELTDRY